MENIVIDTLAASRRLQKLEGITLEEADRLAHDLAFGIYAMDAGDQIDDLVASVERQGSEQLELRLKHYITLSQGFQQVVKRIPGEAESEENDN